MNASTRCPLPEDPALAAMAKALNDAGHWADIYDAAWRWAYVTDALALGRSARPELSQYPLGALFLGPELIGLALALSNGGVTVETQREVFTALGPWMLAEVPGGRDELRERVDPRLSDIVDGLSPAERTPALSYVTHTVDQRTGAKVETIVTAITVRDSDGRVAGTATVLKPAASMTVLGAQVATGDIGHLERMQQVAKAGRRPAAILFADLEGSLGSRGGSPPPHISRWGVA